MSGEILIRHSKISGLPSDGETAYVQGPDWDSLHNVSINSTALTAVLNVFSAFANGLVPASGLSDVYLKGDGSWSNATTLTAFLNAFTVSLKGLVPPSGGGTTNFLRADGAWIAPSVSVSTGRLLAIQLIGTVSGIYVPTPGTTFVKGRGVGGGGGSAGVPSCPGGQQAVSGGGASGCYLEWMSGALGGALVTGGPFACGAAGAAGTSFPTDGGNGGDTTIVINGVTIIMKGGLGSLHGVSAVSSMGKGGFTQAGSTAGSFSVQEAGKSGQNISAVNFYGGAGGSTPLGAGGPEGFCGTAPIGTGQAGTGFGSGGGGAATNATNYDGAPGGFGFIILEEYA